MTNPDCFYVVQQRKTYSPKVKRYAFYKTPYEASLHGTLQAVAPFEHSDDLPTTGTQGVDWCLYSQFAQTKS